MGRYHELGGRVAPVWSACMIFAMVKMLTVIDFSTLSFVVVVFILVYLL